MPKSKLTKQAIALALEDASLRNRDVLLMDATKRNFGLRIYKSGTASWIVRIWLGGRGGKLNTIVVGEYPAMNLRDAYKKADIIIGKVKSGVDVIAERKGFILETKQRIEAGNLESAVERYLKRKEKKSDRYYSETKRLLEKEFLAKLGPKTSLASINKAVIRKLIEDKKHEAPGVARYLFAVLRPFFAWTVEQDLIETSPMNDLTPPDAPAARDRVLNDAEIIAFWRGCEELGYPFGPAWQLLLLTGQRREEVSAMRWDEIDFDKCEWIIPRERTKNKKEHVVHLSKHALAILNAIPRRDSPFVFTTTLKTSISGYSKAKRRLDEIMQSSADKPLKPWRLHDLRRTAASGMAALNTPPHIVERVINHLSGAQGGLVSVYQRHEYMKERAHAINIWNNHVVLLITKQASNNVVVFNSAIA